MFNETAIANMPRTVPDHQGRPSCPQPQIWAQGSGGCSFPTGQRWGALRRKDCVEWVVEAGQKGILLRGSQRRWFEKDYLKISRVKQHTIWWIEHELRARGNQKIKGDVYHSSKNDIPGNGQQAQHEFLSWQFLGLVCMSSLMIYMYGIFIIFFKEHSDFFQNLTYVYRDYIFSFYL